MARTWESDVSAAAWIAPRLNPGFQDTGSIVPVGFDAYARVFHPAGDGQERWTDIAYRNGRIPHPEMQLHRISSPVGNDHRPAHPYDLGEGFNPSPPREVLVTLVEVLRAHTSTPDDCWFCVWEGYGGLDDEGLATRVEHPGRAYLLAHGPIGDAAPPWPDEAPNIWWPQDRAWIVVSEIDFAWTYVGGSADAIDAVVSAPGLEALPARIDHRPFYDSDLLNADPADDRETRT